MGSLNDHDPQRLAFARDRVSLLPQAETSTYRVGRNCAVDDTVKIGVGTVIQDNVVILGDVQIGKNCLIKPGTVIGAKGFSFGFEEDLTPIAIGHSGGVRIGDRVEIGALCTVCQGTVNNTVIEDDCKLDDHIHIAHNCYIKAKTVIAAGAIFGGGVTVGKASWVGLQATIMNQANLGDRVVVGTQANVIRDAEDGTVLVGNPATVLRMRV
jgi:UDP-3-O-[3-hydroxymyristoyl] glucosamine N-acyltransferase